MYTVNLYKKSSEYVLEVEDQELIKDSSCDTILSRRILLLVKHLYTYKDRYI